MLVLMMQAMLMSTTDADDYAEAANRMTAKELLTCGFRNPDALHMV